MFSGGVMSYMGRRSGIVIIEPAIGILACEIAVVCLFGWKALIVPGLIFVVFYVNLNRRRI